MTNNTTPEVKPDDTPAAESIELNLRCIRTNTGESVFTIVTEELEDSFLVAAPTKLVSNEDNSFSAVPLSPMGHLRIMKSAVFYTSEISNLYKYWYYKYLYSKSGGIKLIPEVLTQVVLDDLLAYTRKFQLENPAAVEVIPADAMEAGFPMPVPESVSERYEKLGITGISNEAFEPTVMKLSIH